MNFDTSINYDQQGNKTMTLKLWNKAGDMLELAPEEIPVLFSVLKDVNSTVKANSK